MKYFAYGSNMNLVQMRYRCPGAKKIGNGRLSGYEICFPRKSPSRQGKGVASICEKANTYVEGVVFELTSTDWNSLDRYEGVPDIYIRRLVAISMNDGKEIEAETYIANQVQGSPFKPAKLYMDFIIHGAEENGLSKDYIEKLKKIEYEEE
jgi:gamma-glutamylcyclotransferase (GGCT)/AIG2-like uncharacterized protein YtfP